MKSQAIANRVNSKLFHFYKPSKSFIGEMSEIMSHGGNPIEQLYHDEGVEGFVMVSAKTGSEVEFFHWNTEREADGETRAWLFKATPFSISRQPELVDVMVTILND